MAVPTTNLFYFDGSNWTQALTHNGKNAVIVCRISKNINSPSSAEIILTNKSKNYSSTTTSKAAVNSSQGKLTGVFTEFTDCYIRDEETGTILFRGRVVEEQNQYNLMQGSTIRLILKDMLQELADYPTRHAPQALRSINRDSSDYDTRSEVVAYVVSKVSNNFSTSDTAKFEASQTAYTSNEKKTGDFTGANNALDITKAGKGNILQTVHGMAMHEPHADSITVDHFGYDFYADPNFTSSATSHNPSVGLNYYMRGTRPGAGGSTASDPSKYGLTIEHPSAGWSGQTDFSKPMLNDADFDTTSAPVFSSAVVQFIETAQSEADTTNRYLALEANYELFGATLTGSFTWTDRRLIYIHDASLSSDQSSNTNNPQLLYRANPTTAINMGSNLGNNASTDTSVVVDSVTDFVVGQTITVDSEQMLITAINTSTNTFTVTRQYNSTSVATHNDDATVTGKVENPCATVHYQSGTGSSKYLILSNVYDEKTTEQFTNETGITFDPFPTSSSSVRFFLTTNTAASATPSVYADLTPSTSRRKTVIGYNKPIRLQYFQGDISRDGIRKEIVGSLDRTTSGSVTRARVSVIRYPMTKLRAPAANISRSSNVLTFATAPTATTNINMAGNFGASATELIVDSASGFSVNDIITCVTSGTSEQMQITDIDSNTFTVTRGVNGTTAVQHADDLAVAGTGAFTPADKGTAINNPLTFGAKTGMVIAELNDSGNSVNRYAYISAVSSTTVTYGSSATDTSDGTALDASKPMAVYIPAEPGHVVKVKNKIWDKDYSVLIESMEYSVENGFINCVISAIGMDTNGTGVPISLKGSSPLDIDLPPDIAPGTEKWTIPNGHIRSKPGVHNVIEVVEDSGSTVTVHPSGRSYTLKGGDATALAITGDAAFEWHTLFLRPSASANVASPLSTDRQDLQVIPSTASSTNYTKIADPRNDIILGRAKANRDSGAVAILELYGTTGSVTSDANVSTAGEVVSGTANAARVVHNSAGISAFNASGTRVLNIIPGSGATTNGRITVGQEGVANMNYIQIYGGDNSSQGGVIFADPDSGTESSDGSQYIQFDHNAGVSGNSSSGSTKIYRQGSGAVGEIAQGGRNLIIRDNGSAIDDAAHQYAASTTADSSTLAVGSYAKFFNIAPLAPRYFAQTHTVSSAEKSGSKAKPVYTFYGDDNTGIYSNGPDQVNIATGGTAALTITSSLLSLSGGVQTTGHILIGTSTAPSATSTLRINEGGGAAISDNWLTWSRAEYKENIADLSSGYLQKLINSPPKSWLKKPFVSAEDIKIAAINEFGQDEWDKIFPTETAHRNKALWNMPEGEMKTWIDNWAESQRVELRKLPQYQIKHIGSIADADSTNTYLPEIVANDDNNEPEGITVMSYIGILHAAIIELKTEIDALKNG